MVAAACSGSTTTHRGAPLPAPPVTIDVSMTEYHFGYDTSVLAGRVVFRVHDDGKVPHRFALYPLTDDFPPINDQLHGAERRILTQFGSEPILSPGQSSSVALDLAPNQRYAMICFVPNDDGQVHALLGMNSEFRTTGTPATPSASPH